MVESFIKQIPKNILETAHSKHFQLHKISLFWVICSALAFRKQFPVSLDRKKRLSQKNKKQPKKEKKKLAHRAAKRETAKRDFPNEKRNKTHWVKSKKSSTGPTERTPKKPEYLIARSQLTERGPLGFGPIQFLMD